MRTCAYQEVRNVSFSANFVYVLNLHCAVNDTTSNHCITALFSEANWVTKASLVWRDKLPRLQPISVCKKTKSKYFSFKAKVFILDFHIKLKIITTRHLWRVTVNIMLY